MTLQRQAGLDGEAAPIPDLSELAAGPRFRGGLDGLHGGHIIGWLVDLERRTAPLDVVLVLEGIVFGKQTTFIQRLDLVEYIGKNLCGFDFDLWSFQQSSPIAAIRKLRNLTDAQLDDLCNVRIELDGASIAIEACNFAITRRKLLDDLTRSAPPGTKLPTRRIVPKLIQVPAELAKEPGEDKAGGAPPSQGSGTGGEAALLRANRRVQALATQVKGYELEISRLSSRVNRLQSRVEVLETERQKLADANQELRREERVLTAKTRSLEWQRATLFNQANDLRASLLKLASNLGSHLEGFDRYSRQVEYDPRRLFAFALEADVQQSSLASAETRRHARAVRDLFDPLFYTTTYSDLSTSGINPLLHYITIGSKEGRRPNILFDVAYYKAQAGRITGDPLLHFARTGTALGLNPHPLFDCRFYLKQNPDVAAAGWNPLFHYQTVGALERRDPSLCFDTNYFLSLLPAAETIESPLEHYLAHWKADGIDPHPLFSTSYFAKMAGIAEFDEAPLVQYLRSRDLHRQYAPHALFSLRYLREVGILRPDSSRSPLEEYLAATLASDVSPHPVFDADLYRFQIEIEKGRECMLPSVMDYLMTGHLDETLLPNLFFDPELYRTQNSLQLAGPALVHYLEEGDALGLACHQIFNSGYYNAQRHDKLPMTALEHMTRYPNEGLIPDHRLGRPIDPDILSFVRAALSSASEFDVTFYKEASFDLKNMTDEEARNHFIHSGRAGGRSASPRSMIRGNKFLIRDIPIGMSPNEYCDLSPDLAELYDQPLRCIMHYFCHGRGENRLVGKWQLKLDALALDFPTSASPLRTDAADLVRKDVCILTHIFYADLWTELAGFARNFDVVTRDVFVNVVDLAWTPQFHLELRRLAPGAFVQLSNDDGRDIGGFMRLLDNVDLDRYDIFAFMHSKKSPHIPIERGNHWRQGLMRAFAGTPEIVRQCVDMFHDDPAVGIVAAEKWRSDTMGNNYEQYEKLLDLFGIEGENRKCDYLSGTMFLVRQPIVKRLHEEMRKIDWEYGGDKDVEFHKDGQIAHGVERVIPALARHLGFKVVWV